MRKTLLTVAIAAVLSVGLTGCGGGSTTATTEVSTQTLGQELIDLKKAYDSGAMTEREYNRAREQLIKSRK